MTTVRELADALRLALQAPDLTSVPLPVRALLAGTLMCARGGAPSRLGMATVGRYSYGSSQNHYPDLLDALVQQLPRILAGMVDGELDPAATARLREELQHRDRTIRDLRTDLEALTQRHEQVRRYALALHERLRVLDADLAVTEATVHPLRPPAAPRRRPQ